jgi:hypothetical protein
MVVTSDVVVDLGGTSVGAETVRLPTLCGSPYGYHPPPEDNSVGYILSDDPSPIVAITDAIEELTDTLEPLAVSIGMGTEMFAESLTQYATWAVFSEGGLAMADPPSPSSDSILDAPMVEPVGPGGLGYPGGPGDAGPQPVSPGGGGLPISGGPTGDPATAGSGPGSSVSHGGTPPPAVLPLTVPQAPPESAAGGFGPATIVTILAPQLTPKGATPDQIQQIASTLWVGVDTTLKAVDPSIAGAILDAGLQHERTAA